MALISTLCALALSGQAATPTSSVPFRIAENAIIVDATVNGRNVSLMFDTGFGASVDVNDNINLGKQTGTAGFRDFVGTFEVPTVKINSLKLGDKSIDPKDLPEAAMTPGDYSASYGMHCDGLMGLATIKNNISGINFEKQRFEFYPSSVDISKWVPDNKKTFLAKLLPTGNSSLEMAVETPSGKRLVLALDTGNAYYATTHKDVLERVGLWDGSSSPKFISESFVASGPVDSWALRLKDMKIFGIPVPSGVWDIIDLPSSSAEGDGTVGFGFLHNFNIIFDYERRRVWFENYTGKTADEELGEPGIVALSSKKGDVTIVNITPNSPAEAAGIKKGDVILAVNGTDLDGHLSYRRMRKMLEGPIGSKLQLTISQSGELKRLELQRVAMVNEPSK